MDGINLMAEYTFLSKYSQKKPNGRLESWEEVNHRIYQMHRIKLGSLNLLNPHVEAMLVCAEQMENERKLLSSQRARQFASTDYASGILKHETKMYNCCSTYIDRLDVFGEIMYLLLCGCGVGFSLHKNYIKKLPSVPSEVSLSGRVCQVDDSIEGWATSIKEQLYYYFKGEKILFDYTLVRPKGALIDNKFKAPGPDSLSRAHSNIYKLLDQHKGERLRSIDIHDLVCYIAECVVSGGVRRSALISLFDKDDVLMQSAKTGSWWEENPQRAMANNSILTTHDDMLSYSEMKNMMQVVKQFGEPGFVCMPDYSYTTNPCGEIFMRPQINGRSGFAFCNLVEINAEKITSPEDFYTACKVASFVATVQSLYTDFKYLSKNTLRIAERDRNIGVSITAVMGNPIVRDRYVLEKGATIVRNTNQDYADLFDINPSRTCTTIKPSGNASTILGLVCSGIHPAHSPKYLRRIRITENSPEYQALKDTPLVQRHDYPNSDGTTRSEFIISFPINCEGNSNILFKDDLTAVEHIEVIRNIKHFWVNKSGKKTPQVDGGKRKFLSHNVSATVEVMEDEWDEVAAALYTNKYILGGISLLAKAGDEIYPSAPFTRLSNKELEAEYEEIVNYISNNHIDFLSIMSGMEDIEAGSLSAIGCSGGMCELR